MHLSQHLDALEPDIKHINIAIMYDPILKNMLDFLYENALKLAEDDSYAKGIKRRKSIKKVKVKGKDNPRKAHSNSSVNLVYGGFCMNASL